MTVSLDTFSVGLIDLIKKKQKIKKQNFKNFM